MANKKQNIEIKRGSKQADVLTPIPADELYFTPEMIAQIKESQQQINDGKGIVIRTKEELNTFFDTL